MLWIDWVAVVMVGVGALFMLLSIQMAIAMLPRLTEYYKKQWFLLTVFKGFFLIGYLAFIVILVMDLNLPVELVTGIVFLGGAFFVFLVIRLSKYTITDLTDKEIALSELNSTLEKKVQQRTSELEISMLNISKEIEERKKANQETSRIGQELRQILDTISTGIRVIDLNHNVIQVNKQFCLQTGLACEELVGSPCYENFISEDCLNSKKCRLKTIEQQTEIIEEIITKTTRQGKELHFRITSAPLHNSDGEIVGILEDFQDITPLIKAQEEKELAQSQRHQAAKLESVGQLAAGIAHEINTPVQFVASNMDFLKESFEDVSIFMNRAQTAITEKEAAADLGQDMELVDWGFLAEEVPQAIGQSMDGMEQIRKLVLAMKEFSHPTTREMAPADIHKIIGNTIMISQSEWKHVAELQTDFAEDLPLVPCLGDEMGQVFLNILVNGAHAVADVNEKMKKLGRISVRTILGNGMAEISISDTGKGINKELCAKIFDPFFTTKEVGKGTGQGLSIAYDIVVNKHNGSLTVESTPGVGTTFLIRLPLKLD